MKERGPSEASSVRELQVQLEEMAKAIQEEIDEESQEDTAMVLALIENIQDLTHGVKDIENMEIRKLAAFMAQMNMLYSLTNMDEEEDEFEDEELEDLISQF